MTQMAGMLYLCGVALMVLAIALPHPVAIDEFGLGMLAAATALASGLLLLGKARARAWTVHAALVGGSLQVCASMYFSGMATGVFTPMFVWVVILASFFFPGRRAFYHLTFLLFAYGAGIYFLDQGGFEPFTRWILNAFALSIAWGSVSWLVLGLNREKEQRDDAERLARTDELTTLPNRRWLHDELGREIARAQRQGFEIWAAVIDLDHFKKFNDRFGHAAGDALLREAANEWRSVLRVSDFLARTGGEEFVLLLPDCDRAGAEEVIERVREATPLAQTCSVGYARWDRIESGEDLIKRADVALYRAKASGRDRSETRDSDPRRPLARSPEVASLEPVPVPA